MSLKKLAKQCRMCPYKDACPNKRMELHGVLEPTQQTSNMQSQESMIVPHDYRQVKIAPNTEITIDLEDFKKEIEKQISSQLGLGFFQSGG